MELIASAQNWTATNWRFYFSAALLLLAAIPVRLYSVPGFEITPSLLLASAALVVFRPTERIHYLVGGFLLFCMLLALAGIVGSEGRIRNLIGAASYSSGAPYVFVGMALARNNLNLSKVWQIILPVAVAMTLIFATDLLTTGNILQSSSYSSISYSAKETTYIRSFFPFYGQYAVITLATVAMVIGAFSVGSVSSFSSNILRLFVLIFSNALIFLSFSMLTRQVMMGVFVFYAMLILLASRRKETWLSIVVFLILLAPWAYNLDGSETGFIGSSEMTRGLHDIERGDMDDLSTGRFPLYRNAISKVTPRITLVGCGFCNLKDVMKFPFSTLHNVILTAIFKGGIIYAILYLGAAFCSLILLWFVKKSFARDVTIAVVASIAVQSMINDVTYFQVIPALLFTLTGYLLAMKLVPGLSPARHAEA